MSLDDNARLVSPGVSCRAVSGQEGFQHLDSDRAARFLFGPDAFQLHGARRCMTRTRTGERVLQKTFLPGEIKPRWTLGPRSVVLVALARNLL